LCPAQQPAGAPAGPTGLSRPDPASIGHPTHGCEQTARCDADVAVWDADVLPPCSSWEVTIKSTGVLSDAAAGRNIVLKVVDKTTDKISDGIPIESLGWEDKAPVKGNDGLIKGWSRKGVITLPAGITSPAAILVTKKGVPESKFPSVDFISTVAFKK
jgi:hypothetical protein